MLDKLKQLQRMKKAMDEISVTEKVGEIEIEMSGNMEVKAVRLGDKEKLTERDTQNCFNGAVKSVQQKMMGQLGGGLPF
ncbi:MAG: hypothetical protein COU85_02185 [Candidatus Portnoybacteria bacterium CG10_big_fil_rev_8_21_14_0_10_44_7]|uniref:Nucleoid-associated protein, YbaB/EbfC family n=1 Tax=Candidatus Portnoybacteria bacterium CG10_big_fil_rev_8_21_14_0_10_44_7 TaxID=1974816 RepID=A0A2M8KIH3_9BACT|nr:MAG: hypothetical protein COU85_02185 [Candidatus Portnoybacteria bacterium CG10_big_fil_rev_8_21_14_0_10_44_7]